MLSASVLTLQGLQGQPHGGDDDAESQEDEVQRRAPPEAEQAG